MRTLIGMILLLFASMSHAHKPSDSYLVLTPEGERVRGQWDIALRDLDYAIGLDGNNDGEITWGELRARQTTVAAYALLHLQVSVEDAACSTQVDKHLVDNHTDGAYAVLQFTATCPKTVDHLTLAYSLFFDLDPQHRGLLRLDHGGATRTAILSPEQSQHQFDLATAAPWQEFLAYGQTGVWHIWIGYDHILFLLSLLLPAVLCREGGLWRPVAGFRLALVDVFKIVTAFTLAHSITLSLAVLSVIALPSRLVESAIAASVVLAALNNLFPLFYSRRWVVAFVFGLVHGLGFANVLTDLGLPKGSLVLALVGFNLGVEVGQLAIVAAFLPLAYALRASLFYRHLAFGLGSALIALIASIWLVERSFDLRLLTG